MLVHENPSRSAVSEILRPARLAPGTMPRSKSLKSPFFPNSDARFELQQIVLMISTCLNASSCCLYLSLKFPVSDLKIISTGLISLGRSALHHVTGWCTTKHKSFKVLVVSWMAALSFSLSSITLSVSVSLSHAHTHRHMIEALCFFLL